MDEWMDGWRKGGREGGRLSILVLVHDCARRGAEARVGAALTLPRTEARAVAGVRGWRSR